MVSALIMPRSAMMQMRPMEKRRWRSRSTTGTRLPVSAVLPGHIRCRSPAIAVQEHGEDHLPQVRPVILGIAVPAERLAARASKYRLVVSMNTRSSLVNRSRRFSNRRSSTTSLRQRGANGVRPSCSGRRQFVAEPGHRPIEMMQFETSTPSIR